MRTESQSALILIFSLLAFLAYLLPSPASQGKYSSSGEPRLFIENAVLSTSEYTYSATVAYPYSTTSLHYSASKKQNILVVSVHGNGGSIHSPLSKYLLEACQEIGVDFFTFDGMGFGNSGGSATTATLKDRLAQVKRVVEDGVLAGEGADGKSYNQVIMVGHSLGGLVTSTSIRDLEVLRSKLRGVLLLAPALVFSSGELDIFRGKFSAEQEARLKAGEAIEFMQDGILKVEVTQKMLDESRALALDVNGPIKGDFKIELLWGLNDKVLNVKLSKLILDAVEPRSRITLTKMEGTSHTYEKPSDRQLILSKLRELVESKDIASYLISVIGFAFISLL